MIQGGKRATAKLLGVSNEYFEIFNLPLEEGAFFNEYQEENGIPVCVIGANIKNKFFSKENPIGKYIKFDKVWLKVVGVLEKNDVDLTRFENIGVNVMNDNIYVPVKTMLMRYQNRALVASRIKGSRRGNDVLGWDLLSVSAERKQFKLQLPPAGPDHCPGK